MKIRKIYIGGWFQRTTLHLSEIYDFLKEVKIYEDGLIVLCQPQPIGIIKDLISDLTSYYEKRLSPAISYIFSLGAPIPKELANIKTIINEQIFMREFKGQLHRYLNLHRIIWERIAEVKERGRIKGDEIAPFKDQIEGYAKTINLIKDIWGMTKNYVNSALDIFSGLQAKSTESSVKNLTVITSMGVGATLINLFTQQPPKLNLAGAVYFIALALVGYLTNLIMKKIAMRRMYKIRNIGVAKDI